MNLCVFSDLEQDCRYFGVALRRIRASREQGSRQDSEFGSKRGYSSRSLELQILRRSNFAPRGERNNDG